MVVPPGIGIDVGISKTHGKYLVSSSDPITGTKSRMGWHAVNVSANDVATSGIMPDLINVVALFPDQTRSEEIKHLMKEITMTARGLGITVSGGHTEITPGLNSPIIVVTAIGSGSSYVTAAGAKPGDVIIMTKTAGLEGTSILARLSQLKKLVARDVLREGERLISQLSILPEAKAAFRTGKVHAMHDVTEGGVLGAVIEMSLASNLGFRLRTESVPVQRATRVICSKLGLEPLQLIGSGSLLISCSASDVPHITSAIALKGVKSTVIGEFVRLKDGRQILLRNRWKRLGVMSIEDELWRALRKYGDFS